MNKIANSKNGGGHLLNKGFTLIELLAVIIILAIIALIATPIILNVIDEAKVSAGKSEVNMILSGINNYCATETVKEEMDENYTKKCTTGMNIDTVKEMVNLGNATIDKIIYDGNKLTELEITSNNHRFRLCPTGTFAMDDEECKVIQTGPIKDVVLSNFPYLATNGNGCLTPSDNNYSYMGGCYLKGSGQSGKDIFIAELNGAPGLDSIDIINEKFFDSEGNFKAENFENWAMTDGGISESDLTDAGVSTVFELIYGTIPEEFFSIPFIGDNSVWYSGFLWRIMGINADGTVRLITSESVTAIPYYNDNSFNWDDSYAKDWLNNYFYPRLKGNNIITEQTWCSEIATDYKSARVTCTSNLSKELAKIGLITLDEYNLAGGKLSYLRSDGNVDIWMLTPGLIGVWSTINTYASDTKYGYPLRPIINVSFDANITGGDGTLETTWSNEVGPYILNEYKNETISGKLNEKATSGEYVLFAGKKYRIVSKDDEGNIKIILDGNYEENQKPYQTEFGSNSNFTVDSGIGKKLNTDVLEWLIASDDVINRNKLVTNYTWYQNNFADGDNYKVSLNEINPTRSVQATVGSIRIGEMLSSQSYSVVTSGFDENDFYWTITPKNNSTVYGITYGSVYYSKKTYGIRPVLVIKSTTEIIGGTGTLSNPYQI